MAWKDLYTNAVNRLKDLNKEIEEIYEVFPHLKLKPEGVVHFTQPKVKAPKRRYHRKRHYNGTHWTQQPKNRAKVAAAVKRMHTALLLSRSGDGVE